MNAKDVPNQLRLPLLIGAFCKGEIAHVNVLVISEPLYPVWQWSEYWQWRVLKRRLYWQESGAEKRRLLWQRRQVPTTLVVWRASPIHEVDIGSKQGHQCVDTIFMIGVRTVNESKFSADPFYNYVSTPSSA